MMIEITESDEITLISYTELAKMLGVNRKKACEVVESGDIPLVRLGPKSHRVRLADVKRFINRGGRRADV